MSEVPQSVTVALQMLQDRGYAIEAGEIPKEVFGNWGIRLQRSGVSVTIGAELGIYWVVIVGPEGSGWAFEPTTWRSHFRDSPDTDVSIDHEVEVLLEDLDAIETTITRGIDETTRSSLFAWNAQLVRAARAAVPAVPRPVTSGEGASLNAPAAAPTSRRGTP